MKRLIEAELYQWKMNRERKPLLINGIRQVGKTWIVKEFGKKHFKQLIYLNFDLEPNLCDIFKKSKDPKKIILELSILFEKRIDYENTLFFFDEIQSCNEALNSLKYFEEADESYFIIGAGSYLGITLAKGESFPVGKVDLIELKPMSFKEFLMAHEQQLLIEYMEAISHIEALPEPIFDKMKDYLRSYYIVGGMPEAVKTWITNPDIEAIEKVQENILNSYYRDFSKYPPIQIIPRILGIWKSLINQLSRENKKFKFSDIDKGARAREYETALDWLIAGGYVQKVLKVEKPEIPLLGYTNDSHFKIYMPDIGLLRRKAEYPASSFSSTNDSLNIPFKGAMTENVVLQELCMLSSKGIFYWANNLNEVDFVIQREMRIFPIEVKYGENVKSKSLTKLLDEYSHLIGIRYSMKNLSFDGRILNIPLPLISETDRIINMI